MQVAKHRGIKVIGTVRRREQAGELQALGTDVVSGRLETWLGAWVMGSRRHR